MEKVESFITILRWKADFFDKKERVVSNMDLGFKSNFTPPQHELLPSFESDIFDQSISNQLEVTLRKKSLTT